jgi:UDP-N-acetylmuramoyl-tripeptide--D-alanyl-D-alanine ligase
MTLSKIATVLQGDLCGSDGEFAGISIDSRTLKPGDLFFAIKGDNFDGHEFVQKAQQKQACAAVVSHAIPGATFPQIIVKDTLQALGALASYKRQQLNSCTLAVTGSCGKTTTKSMMAAILQHCGAVHTSQGSFNNYVGLPLTLFAAQGTPDYLVLELGANHPGEIAYLTAIAQPNIAVITNAAACHLEGFGSIAGVARAKGEIFKGLPSTGFAILNRDDEHFDDWKALVGDKKIVTFGLHPEAMVMAKAIATNAQGQCHFTLVTPKGEVNIQLPLLGEHNVKNALAAAAACIAADASLAAVKQGLEEVTTTSKRLVTQQGLQGATVIDDSYNANPHSMHAAIDLLAQFEGEKILIIGDMGELGPNEQQYHYEIGQAAKKAKIDTLYAVGRLSEQAVLGFGDKALHFSDQSALVHHVLPLLSANQTLLVKGSRSAKMENVVDALTNQINQKG